MKIRPQKQLLKQEVRKTNYFVSEVMVNKGKVPKDSPLSFEDTLSALWNSSFVSVFLENLKRLEDTGELDILFNVIYDKSLPKDKVKEQLDYMVNILSQPLDITWARTNEEDTKEVVRDMFLTAGIVSQILNGNSNPEPLDLDDRDNSVVDQLTAMAVIWGSLSIGSQIVSPVATRIVAEALDLGMDNHIALQFFKDNLKVLIPLKGEIYYNTLSSIVVNRSRNFGRILAFNHMNVVYIQHVAIGDDRTCGRCMLLDGTVYRVGDLVQAIDRFIEASTMEDLITAAPFVNSIDTEANEFVMSNGQRIDIGASSEVLAGSGMIITVHPECRCYGMPWYP